MKIIGIIPARYGSTRLPGKPLKDICGKPMIWWSYRQVEKVKQLDEVYVATDDVRIETACKELGLNVIMTADTHPTVISRICEVAGKIEADYYVVINGDEPLIKPEHIAAVIPSRILEPGEEMAINTITQIKNPAEVNDSANIKVVFDQCNRALYMSRTAIPYPNKRIDFQYWKHVGITGFSKMMLTAYAEMKMGEFESIEGIDHMRFIDAGKIMYFVKIEHAETLSVDTHKDLEKVREVLSGKYQK